MTFLGAADHAEKAAAAARSAKANYTEHADRKIAEALVELSTAVQELAESLHRAS